MSRLHLISAALVVSLVFISSASAAMTATSDGTDTTLTAPGLWEMIIQESTGCIYSFKDLTDAGDGAGGHNNYMGVSAYNYARSLLLFRGRSTADQAFAKSTDDWSARYTYTLSGDGSTFTMTYSDVAASGSYLYNTGYTDGAATVVAGDVLADITVTINAPDANGTRIDYSVTTTGQKTDLDLLSRKYFLHQQSGVYASLADGRGVGVDVTRSLDALDLEWAQATIDDSALNTANGFTAGRTFTLARLTGGIDATETVNGKAKLSYNGIGTYNPAVAPAGQSLGNLWWASIDTMQLNTASAYSPPLPGDFVRNETGYLDINIVAGGGPTLQADFDGDGDVDLDDFVILKTNFGTGTTHAEGDADGDGDVDLDDFVILKNEFGT